jgi:hypothetical protein
MTLIAGIVSRTRDHKLPQDICKSVTDSISRNGNDEIKVFEDSHSYLIKVDIGAFSEPGYYRAADGSVSLLAGEPLLLEDDDPWRSRLDDLTSIHQSASRQWDILKKAQGVFCAVHYQPATGVLNLIADKLSLRPLYYCIDDKLIVFASALRILESIPALPKAMDLRAVTEIVCLGVPLAERTPYTNISVLNPAEILEVSATTIARHRYWCWNAIETSGASEKENLSEAYKRFQSAVGRRKRKDCGTIAYLSGGLDSRCVVAALRSQHAAVNTFNFALPGTQDQIFGNDFATKIHSTHTTIPKEEGDQTPDYSTILSRALSARSFRFDQQVERPFLVWSGEGGSVSLGHVHMNQAIVDFMRAGEIDAAIDEFFRRESVYLPPKLFTAQTFDSLSGLVREGIKSELNRLDHSDPARNFYLFLMFNDQRRKLFTHFEEIDLHRLEYQLPFFDSAFLALVVSLPIELCLYHRFYTRWLAQFQVEVTSVPWQVYPGHEPCPVPLPEGLAYQWDRNHQHAQRTAQKQRIMKQASALLAADSFPHWLLHKRNLRLAVWVHSTGLRDYGHIIRAAQIYDTYLKRSDGKYFLSDGMIGK